MSAALTLFISDVQVEVNCALREVSEALATAWAPCRTPLLSPVREVHFAVEQQADGYSVRAPGAAPRHVELRQDVLPVLEGALYAALPAFHRERVVLHAACVRRAPHVVLLVGRSGAGKSSLALEAVRAGFEYFTDELTVTDGARIWGVPRALQFEPVSAEQQLPAWLQDDVRRDIYALRLSGDRIGALPLYVPPPGQVARAPAAAAEVRVFGIERAADTRFEPSSPLATLGMLHEAAFTPPRLDLGALLGPGRGGRLTWHEPRAAIELIADLLGAVG